MENMDNEILRAANDSLVEIISRASGSLAAASCEAASIDDAALLAQQRIEGLGRELEEARTELDLRGRVCGDAYVIISRALVCTPEAHEQMRREWVDQFIGFAPWVDWRGRAETADHDLTIVRAALSGTTASREEIRAERDEARALVLRMRAATCRDGYEEGESEQEVFSCASDHLANWGLDPHNDQPACDEILEKYQSASLVAMRSNQELRIAAEAECAEAIAECNTTERQLERVRELAVKACDGWDAASPYDDVPGVDEIRSALLAEIGEG